MLKYRIYTSLTPLQAQWDSVVEKMPQASPFMYFGYQQAWWENLGVGTLHCIEVFDSNNQTVGIAPLFEEIVDGKKQLFLVGKIDESDYLDVIIDPTYKEEVYTTLITAIKELEWDSVLLTSLAQSSDTLSNFFKLITAEKWQSNIEQQTVCPVITLPTSFDDYKQSLEPSFLKRLQKQDRELKSDDEVSYRVITSVDEMPAAITTFIQLHKQSGSEKASFWTPQREKFFAEVALGLAQQNIVKLYFLDVNRDPAAGLFIFDTHNQFLLYNSGFNAYRYGHYGVGNLLVMHTIEEAIKGGKSRYDFMRGDEAYKFQFGAQPEPLYNLHITR